MRPIKLWKRRRHLDLCWDLNIPKIMKLRNCSVYREWKTHFIKKKYSLATDKIICYKITSNIHTYIYRVSHKGWDCKDALNPLMTIPSLNKAYCLGVDFLWFILRFVKEIKKFKVAGNLEYIRKHVTDSINSVQTVLTPYNQETCHRQY